MKQAQLKNAIIFKATLPEAELLSGHLNEVLFTAIAENEKSRAGFISNIITGELVTPFNGGLSVSLRIDEKIMPSHVINKEVNERAAVIESQTGKKLKRAERNAVKDIVISELCKKAFVKTTVINAYYNIEHAFLIVATGSKSFASLLVSYLVKAVGSIKTETIHISDIKHGLTTRLKRFTSDEKDAFDGFYIGDFVQLSRKGEQNEVIKYAAEIDTIKSELADNLNDGFIVDQMCLCTGDLSFLLTENFHFKRINTRDDVEYDDEDDIPYRWRHEAAVLTIFLTDVINRLCILLSYKPTEKE